MRDEPVGLRESPQRVIDDIQSKEVERTRIASAGPNYSGIGYRKTTKSNKTNVADRSLSPVSSNAMNALNGLTIPSAEPTKKSKSTSTIRSVPSDQGSLLSTSQDDPSRRAQGRSDPTAMPHYTGEHIPAIPVSSSLNNLTRQHSNSTGLSVASSVVRRISSEFGPTRSLASTNGLHIPEDSASTSETHDTNDSNSASSANGVNGSSLVTSPLNPNTTQQWSTAVGRSTLGKSGRVIEKLQNQLDTMRRELTSEKANTVEYRNAVALAETKMGQMREEYDIALHDAAIAKTSLKRRERQVAEMKAQIESEKQRADKAVEREKGWREQMEKVEEESKRKVEEAQMHAALMDGRVKAMSSHWKDQGAEVNRTVVKLRTEIGKIVEARRADDNRMNMLQGLCDQQAEQLTSLQAEKEAIERKFEEYKREQEQALQDIKTKAISQEQQNESKLQETQEVLGQLKWALNLQKNTRSPR
ncbi:uncharacterized protein LY89DRAFT_722978 [Mollisia scopiformis]|uniref:SWI5-dependent HO expression protein 3 n=1 Tax=Mollisia scopiformis TaxID=149040 RepID=A0A194WT35_MOLSC|nr:uncharacterized protein LY89DRAFT_722978 [Mollisia scopiformis]KUJ11121.1 hypothetical protein LY89DRAFT_722978 [Mollisia scopiformis]